MLIIYNTLFTIFFFLYIPRLMLHQFFNINELQLGLLENTSQTKLFATHD